MNISPFQAIYPKVDLITSPESFFGSMKYQFKEFFLSGFFDKAEQASIYLYQIHNSENDKKSLGLICCTDIKDLAENRMLKHERTLAAKEQQMMRLILQRDAFIKPVLLTYPDVPLLNKRFETVIKKSDPAIQLRFEEENEVHSIWKISDNKELNEVIGIFKKHVPKSYIADGHHRCTTTEILHKSKELGGPKNRFSTILTCYFPLSQLKIWDFNRTVQIFDQMDQASFFVELSKYFKLKKIAKGRKPKSKFEITMFIKEGWFSLKWKKKILAEYKDQEVLLDCKLFNDYILSRICNIRNVRDNQRINYYSGKLGIQAIEEETRKSSKNVGFCIYPVLKDELLKTADLLETLPPKSTFFEPRMKNGILSKEF